MTIERPECQVKILKISLCTGGFDLYSETRAPLVCVSETTLGERAGIPSCTRVVKVKNPLSLLSLTVFKWIQTKAEKYIWETGYSIYSK